jgi:hypothetical protein
MVNEEAKELIVYYTPCYSETSSAPRCYVLTAVIFRKKVLLRVTQCILVESSQSVNRNLMLQTLDYNKKKSLSSNIKTQATLNTNTPNCNAGSPFLLRIGIKKN